MAVSRARIVSGVENSALSRPAYAPSPDLQPFAQAVPHLGTPVHKTRLLKNFSLEGHFNHLMPEMPQAVDDALSLPGVDEHGMGPMFPDCRRHAVGPLHVVQIAQHHGRKRLQALPLENDGGIRTETRHVHAQNHGHPPHVGMVNAPGRTLRVSP